MMSFFRRFAKSPIGLGMFALIIVAFVVTLYEGRAGMDALGGGGGVATVGGETISEAEMARRIQNDLEAEKRQNPTLDMAQYIASGGVERSIDLAVNGRALEAFAKMQGMVASDKLVDGAIASIPAFAGPTGAFDRQTYLQLLSARKVTEKQLREDLAREALVKALVVPASGAAKVPANLVLPYAALLLEGRSGSVAALPSAAFVDGTAPNSAEVQAFYTRNIARYTIPERRVVRYAAFDRTMFAKDATPTDAEIAKAYATNAAQYAPRERRGFTQLIVPSERQANEVLAKLRGTSAFEAAAKAIGRDPIAVPPTDRAGFERLTAKTVADAAFATAQGDYAPITRSGLGFHIVRVDSVTTSAGTPLSAVRASLAVGLTQAKEAKASAEFVARIEDDIAANATFDEIVKKHGLLAATTPPLTADGRSVDAGSFALPPEAQVTLADAFRAEPDDDPAVTARPQGAGHVLWKLDRTVAAAPRPLDAIRTQVSADVKIDKGSKAAKLAADSAVAAINGGTPIAKAIAAIGRPLPPVSPVTATRMELARAQDVPPPLALMFALPPKRARALQMPGKQGWFIVYLDAIARGDANQAPGLVPATQQQLERVVGSEYVEQFARAARTAVGVKIDAAMVARLKRSLTGGGTEQ